MNKRLFKAVIYVTLIAMVATTIIMSVGALMQ